MPRLALALCLSLAVPACTLNVAPVHREITARTATAPATVRADLTLPGDVLDHVQVLVRGGSRTDALATATVVGLRGGGEDETRLTSEFALEFVDVDASVVGLDIVTPRSSIDLWMEELALDVDRSAAVVLTMTHQSAEIEGMEGRIEVLSTSGSMHVSTTGVVELGSSSGSMLVEAGAGNLVTSSGNVLLDVAGWANVSTISGSVAGEIGDGGILGTVSGSLDLALTNAPTRDLVITTVSGSLVLAIPRGAAMSFDISSESGGVSVEVGGARHDGRSYVGDTGGGGALVHIRTGSGSVVVTD